MSNPLELKTRGHRMADAARKYGITVGELQYFIDTGKRGGPKGYKPKRSGSEYAHEGTPNGGQLDELASEVEYWTEKRYSGVVDE
jgi:hypothetical protein